MNFFQPSLKLVSKSREGSRVVKAYDKAQTPYQRILASNHVSKQKKLAIESLYLNLDPMLLYREIGHRQNKLWSYSWIPEIKNIGIELAPLPIPVITKPAPAHAELFLKTLKDAAPKRQYKRSTKPRVPCTWRTRKDPFQEMNDDIELLLRLNPRQTSRQLFEELCRRFPDKLAASQYRTLQRRLKAWRKRLAPDSARISIYTDSAIQSELDQLILRALEQHPNILFKRTNINEATGMS